MTVRKEVAWFATRMEEKLAKNDYKGHWEGCTYRYLIKRIMDNETPELIRALRPVLDSEAGIPPTPVQPTPEQIEAVINEAADMANFAMMIADNMRQFGREVTVVLYGEPVRVHVYPDDVVVDVVLRAMRASGREEPIDRLEFRDATGRGLSKSDEVPGSEFFASPPVGHGG